MRPRPPSTLPLDEVPLAHGQRPSPGRRGHRARLGWFGHTSATNGPRSAPVNSSRGRAGRARWTDGSTDLEVLMRTHGWRDKLVFCAWRQQGVPARRAPSSRDQQPTRCQERTEASRAGCRGSDQGRVPLHPHREQLQSAEGSRDPLGVDWPPRHRTDTITRGPEWLERSCSSKDPERTVEPLRVTPPPKLFKAECRTRRRCPASLSNRYRPRLFRARATACQSTEALPPGIAIGIGRGPSDPPGGTSPTA